VKLFLVVHAFEEVLDRCPRFGQIAVLLAVSQSSRNVGAAPGYYDLAWSVFSTVVGVELAHEQIGKPEEYAKIGQITAIDDH